MSDAVILFSHGSLLCGSSRLLELHAERMRKKCNGLVQIGFLNYSEPSIEAAVERSIDAGARRIIIMPYFLVAGKFVSEDLPARLEKIKQRWPQLDLEMARPIEGAPPMIDAILDSAGKAEPTANWQRHAIADSLALCEKRSNCPLYGTIACKVQEKKH